MRDFTINILNELLNELQKAEYKFITFRDYMENKYEKFVILRHDVDKLPGNSLGFAKLQNNFGIKGTYYFRIVNESFDINFIQKIASLGHEIGYHYEDLAFAKGDIDMAYNIFKKNIEIIRKFYPVKTICMHGSPLSKWDNKKIWEKYSYRDLGIIGEPYFDLNLDQVLYVTDTGRRWDGYNVSIRDKVDSKFNSTFKTTGDIIYSIKKKSLPDKIMFTFHPQRWNNNLFCWSKELILQNLKNIIKKVIVKRKNEL
jgi:hypothetical protein